MHTYVCPHAKISVYLIKIGSVSPGGEVPSIIIIIIIVIIIIIIIVIIIIIII